MEIDNYRFDETGIWEKIEFDKSDLWKLGFHDSYNHTQVWDLKLRVNFHTLDETKELVLNNFLHIMEDRTRFKSLVMILDRLMRNKKLETEAKIDAYTKKMRLDLIDRKIKNLIKNNRE